MLKHISKRYSNIGRECVNVFQSYCPKKPKTKSVSPTLSKALKKVNCGGQGFIRCSCTSYGSKKLSPTLSHLKRVIKTNMIASYDP